MLIRRSTSTFAVPLFTVCRTPGSTARFASAAPGATTANTATRRRDATPNNDGRTTPRTIVSMWEAAEGVNIECPRCACVDSRRVVRRRHAGADPRHALDQLRRERWVILPGALLLLAFERVRRRWWIWMGAILGGRGVLWCLVHAAGDLRLVSRRVLRGAAASMIVLVALAGMSFCWMCHRAPLVPPQVQRHSQARRYVTGCRLIQILPPVFLRHSGMFCSKYER